MSPRTDENVLSDGTRLSVYRYLPNGPGRKPCIVMAHGFTAVRDQALPAYAEAFQQAGYAVLLFDYRHFGASDGEPRQLLDVGRQLADYRAVIAYARGLAGVDPERVVLFGSSFSGGHAVTLGAEDPRIAAVVAQVPFADGRATLSSLPLATTAQIAARAVLDKAGSLVGRGPVYVRCVGAPGTLAVLTAPEAEPGFLSIDPPGSLWRNELAARAMLTVGTYRPITKAAGLAAPLLVTVADKDETVPPEPAAKMGAAAPRGEVIRYPIGHFEVYTGEPFRRTMVDILDFLTRHVPV